MMRFNSMENDEGMSHKKMIITNQEGEDNKNPLHSKQISRFSTPSKLSSTRRQWGGFQNPRIVRVSREFGGKDRHSKVCTIRGLRDRRIRLSIPTAMQLYELQDLLGLNQPSKVVDWLLHVTKNEIDKLPPLQIPPGGLFPQDYSSSSMLANHTHLFGSHSFERGDKPMLSSKDHHQENLENYGGYVSHSHHQLSSQLSFPLANQTSSLQGLLINSNKGLSYNSTYLNWEPPNVSLSQFGNHSFDSQINNNNNNNNTNSNNYSSLALQPSGSSHHHLYLPPPIPTMPSRQMIINNFELSSSSSQQHVVANSSIPTAATLHLTEDHQDNKKG